MLRRFGAFSVTAVLCDVVVKKVCGKPAQELEETLLRCQRGYIKYDDHFHKQDLNLKDDERFGWKHWHMTCGPSGKLGVDCCNACGRSIRDHAQGGPNAVVWRDKHGIWGIRNPW